MQFQEQGKNTMSVGISFPRQDHLCSNLLWSWVKSKTSVQSQQKPAFKEGIWGNFKPFISSQGSKSAYNSQRQNSASPSLSVLEVLRGALGRGGHSAGGRNMVPEGSAESILTRPFLGRPWPRSAVKSPDSGSESRCLVM